MSTLSQRVPVTILTGFLGAGKTTLLNRIMSEQHGHRIAVIENEYGAEGIDSELLVRENDEEIIELSNGCVCCTVRGDISRVLCDLIKRRSSGEIEFEHVVIETTGLADPGPVAQTFFLMPEVFQDYQLDAVVSVVDGLHGMVTLESHPEACAQVGYADRLLISKVDLASHADVALLRATLERLNARAPITEIHPGSLAIGDLLHIGGFDLGAVLAKDPGFLDIEEGSESHLAQLHASEIGSFSVVTSRPFDPMRLEQFLAVLVEGVGADLFRCKGVLSVVDVPCRVILQGVQMVMSVEPGSAWDASESRFSRLVFIGRNLPELEIRHSLDRCLWPITKFGFESNSIGDSESGQDQVTRSTCWVPFCGCGAHPAFQFAPVPASRHSEVAP
jgi:G3E family GTPase